MSVVIFIVGIFAGLCLSLYVTIRMFPVDFDIDTHIKEKEASPKPAAANFSLPF